MACYYPLQAWQLDSGTVVFQEPREDVRRELKLACGQCTGCKLERSRQWAIRCMHESQMHEYSSFLTLTYSDDKVPHDFSLDHRDFQLFMKRLRKEFSHRDEFQNLWKLPIKYYMCGEYGDDFSRPHFHACIFGVFFRDRAVYRNLPSGSTLYSSPTLDKLWGNGFASIGDVTFESAAYVARYVMKKRTGPEAEAHYEAVNGYTGEIFSRKPEYTKMSHGIGESWYKKYRDDIYPQDFVVLRGMKMKPPKAYDKWLKLENNFDSDLVEAKRLLDAGRFSDERTEERLDVRRQVAEARLSFKKRTL